MRKMGNGSYKLEHILKLAQKTEGVVIDTQDGYRLQYNDGRNPLVSCHFRIHSNPETEIYRFFKTVSSYHGKKYKKNDILSALREGSWDGR